MGKLAYLKRSLLNRFSPSVCPSCGGACDNVIDKKLCGITTLLECKNCLLRFRFPPDSSEYNFQFYQDNYVQPGLTTDLPSEEDVSLLMKTNFSASEKDFSAYFPILQQICAHLNRKIRILDYGANWGYSCFQFKQLSFVEEVVGFELSVPRRRYGETMLGIEYVMNPLDLKGKIDVVFTSHVIEHMNNPSILKEHADQALARDGFIVLGCPNGSDSARIANKHWSQLWGEMHPNFISDRFLCRLFSDYNGKVVDEGILSSFPSVNSLLNSKVSSELPASGGLILIAQKAFKAT